jgi:TPR repeat protein
MWVRTMAAALVAVVLLSSAVLSWADAVNDAVNAVHRGDYTSALPVLRRYATAGNADAQSQLGVMYNTGWGVPRDYREALRWLREAAGQANGRGMLNLGLIYLKGSAAPRDYVRAYMWFNLAAAANAIDYGGRLMRARAAAERDALTELMTPAQIAEAQRLARECLASNYKRCGEPEELGDQGAAVSPP